MVVLTQYRQPGKSGPVGLNIGQENAQQFFPRGFDTVELELDHLRISCRLESSFWDGQPVIHDLRLSSWLESKRSSGKLSQQPSPVAMEPRGENAFRLSIIPSEKSDRSLTQAPPDPQKIPQIVSVVPAYNRRRFDAGHEPERRRVARLKADDRSSAAANY